MITGVRAQTRVGGRGKGLGLGHARRYGPFSWKEITKRRGQAHCNAILPGALAPGRRRLQGMPGFKGDDSAVGRLKKSGGLGENGAESRSLADAGSALRSGRVCAAGGGREVPSGEHGVL